MVAIDLVLKFLHVNHTASSQIRPRMIFLDQVVQALDPEMQASQPFHSLQVFQCCQQPFAT